MNDNYVCGVVCRVVCGVVSCKRPLAVSILGHLENENLPLESQRNMAGFKVTLSERVSDLF